MMPSRHVRTDAEKASLSFICTQTHEARVEMDHGEPGLELKGSDEEEDSSKATILCILVGP